MRFVTLAVDYDGTLASQGKVFPETLAALERFSASGRKLVMVTGRELDELLEVFPGIGIFDRVVAENGALLYCPKTKAEKRLGVPPPPEFVPELLRRGVNPLAVGRSIVATVTPNETIVLETIRDFGLEMQVIFNKGAVMVLPAGVNKATGLAAALHDLGLSARNVAAIGDAENDHALLRSAEFGVAVGNALPTLKRDADRTSEFTHGAAVVELIDAILEDDLAAWTAGRRRRSLVLGRRRGLGEVSIAASGSNVLLCGPSGSGKSVYACGVLERLAEQGYQYCVVDPEGDYDECGDSVVLGSTEREPTLDEVTAALKDPDHNVVVNLAGMPMGERPAAFKRLMQRLQELRASLGRPHWLLVAEAHQMFASGAASQLSPGGGLIHVSVHPEKLPRDILNAVEVVIAIGAQPVATIEQFCRAAGVDCPAGEPVQGLGEALAWMRKEEGGAAFAFTLQPSEAQRRQLRRKLAEGELSPERSFYFRGPDKKLNLRAQNLALFMQIGRGVDDDTWLHHLRQQDYSRWLREAVKDPALCAEVEEIERKGGSVEATRESIEAAIQSFVRPAPEALSAQ